MGELKAARMPSAGTVLGAIGALLGLAALVVSLSSSADASPSGQLVRRGDIAPGAVTAKALAKGAVKAKAIAKNAVTAKALAKGAVEKRALADGAVVARVLAANAVTSAAIAPGSVYGGALRELTIHETPIKDLDEVASNPQWTASNTEVAMCGAGERILSAAFGFSNPGNREVTWLQARPFTSPTGDGASGRIASNSGGTAEAQIVAFCLK